MKTVFISFTDSTNMGDQLIVDSIIEQLLSDTTIKLYSFNFQEGRDTSFSYKNSKTNSKIKTIFQKYFRKNLIIDFIVSNIVKFKIKNTFQNSNIDHDIKNSDFILLGGGNAVFDLTNFSDSSYKIKLIIDAAKKYNKKVFVTSIGMGPFQTEKQKNRAIKRVSEANAITVRDQKTYEYFNNVNNVYQSIDPVFVSNFSKKVKVAETASQIGISIIDLSHNKNDSNTVQRYIKSTIKLVHELSNNKNKQIKLYSSEPRDYEVIQEVYEKFRNVTNVELCMFKNREDMISFYRSLDLIIASRMHSSIIGLNMGIPCIGISWQQKVFEMFNLLGLSEYCIQLEDFLNKPETVLQTIDSLPYTKHVEKLSNVASYTEESFKVNTDIVRDIKQSIQGGKYNEFI
jgi:polysaccharide pyruvyl transferase WcaK-like protein